MAEDIEYSKKQKSVYERMQKGTGVETPKESLDERMRKRLERLLGIGKKKEEPKEDK
jgi:hypothetical protein